MCAEYVYKHRTYDAKDIFGQYESDWEKRIDMQALVEKRRDRAREKMKEHGLGALLMFRHENIRYVSGQWAGPVQTGEKLMRYHVLAGDDTHVGFEVPGIDLTTQRMAARVVKDFRPAQTWRSAFDATEEQAKKFAKGVKDVLKSAGVAGEKLGVDQMDYVGFKALENEGLHLADGTACLLDAEKIKFPEEIELIKVACAIQDSAFWVTENAIRPGLRETELKAVLMEELFRLGTERVEHITMGSGGRTNPYFRNGPSDKLIRYGDMVIIDICMQYMGYNTCYYRDFVCGGKPTKRQKELHQESYDSMYAAIDKIRPGVSTAEVAQVWRDMKLHWSDEEHGGLSLLQFGHGVGIHNHERPIITMGWSEKYPDMIEPNMVLSVETIAGEPGESEMARLEEQLLVTPTGHEVLSLYPFPSYFFE
jgi:Xaa-Pro aminopeptidase